MKRRTYLGTIGGTVAIVSGCLSGASTDRHTTDSKRTNRLKLLLENEVTNAITAEVSVTPADGSTESDEDTTEEPVLDKKYELDATSTKEVSLSAAPTEYVVSASMPDGPVESIWEHQWNVVSENSQTITFSENGVDFS